MMSEILELKGKDIKNFESIYKELIKQKVGIIYKIAQEKNENFIHLLDEFVPEARDFSEVWEHEYIFESKKLNTNTVFTEDTTKKKLVLNKIKKNNNSIEETDKNELQVIDIETKPTEVTENNNKMEIKSTEVNIDTIDNNHSIENLSKIEKAETKKVQRKMPKLVKRN